MPSSRTRSFSSYAPKSYYFGLMDIRRDLRSIHSRYIQIYLLHLLLDWAIVPRCVTVMFECGLHVALAPPNCARTRVGLLNSVGTVLQTAACPGTTSIPFLPGREVIPWSMPVQFGTATTPTCMIASSEGELRALVEPHELIDFDQSSGMPPLFQVNSAGCGSD